MADQSTSYGAGQRHALRRHQGWSRSCRLAGFPQERHQTGGATTDGATGRHERHGRNDGRGRRPRPEKYRTRQTGQSHQLLPRQLPRTTADGKTRAFWEHNLRFMTDSSEKGPEKGAPAIMPAGMMGDRAAVIFAAPQEITGMIEPRC